MTAKMSTTTTTTETEVQVVNNKLRRRTVSLIWNCGSRHRRRLHDGPAHGVCLQTLTDPGTDTTVNKTI